MLLTSRSLCYNVVAQSTNTQSKTTILLWLKQFFWRDSSHSSSHNSLALSHFLSGLEKKSKLDQGSIQAATHPRYQPPLHRLHTEPPLHSSWTALLTAQQKGLSHCRFSTSVPSWSPSSSTPVPYQLSESLALFKDRAQVPLPRGVWSGGQVSRPP